MELLDLPQTILDAVGIEHHPGMMGKSLWPLLTGATPAREHREDVYCEFYNACEGHNGDASQPAMATMVRTKEYKLVVAHGHGTGELYDLKNDPGEHSNLWNDDDFKETRLRMLLRLSDRIAMTADPLPARRVPW